MLKPRVSNGRYKQVLASMAAAKVAPIEATIVAVESADKLEAAAEAGKVAAKETLWQKLRA
jgi:hypothetical protein